MLQSLLAYTRGAGVDARWVTIGGDGELLSDHEADPQPPARRRRRRRRARRGGEGGLRANPRRKRRGADPATRRPGTSSTCTTRRRPGLTQRAAVGRRTRRLALSRRDSTTRTSWPAAPGASCAATSSRPTPTCSRAEPSPGRASTRRKLWVVAPSIDAFSPKNQEMEPEAVRAILARAGLADGRRVGGRVRAPGRDPGTRRPCRRARPGGADPGTGSARGPGLTLGSAQGSRRRPARFAERCRHPSAHLLLAGPSVAEVADDPEGAQVAGGDPGAARQRCRAELRARVHLASLPMDDLEENAAIVNAIQRRADVVLQKSLAEGFGLTVAEAMWKSRPVVASRIGGIQDQIVDGESGHPGRPVRPRGDRRGDRRAARRPGAGTRRWELRPASASAPRSSGPGIWSSTWSCSRRCWPARITTREMRVAVGVARCWRTRSISTEPELSAASCRPRRVATDHGYRGRDRRRLDRRRLDRLPGIRAASRSKGDRQGRRVSLGSAGDPRRDAQGGWRPALGGRRGGQPKRRPARAQLVPV